MSKTNLDVVIFDHKTGWVMLNLHKHLYNICTTWCDNRIYKNIFIKTGCDFTYEDWVPHQETKTKESEYLIYIVGPKPIGLNFWVGAVIQYVINELLVDPLRAFAPNKLVPELLFNFHLNWVSLSRGIWCMLFWECGWFLNLVAFGDPCIWCNSCMHDTFWFAKDSHARWN